MITKEQETRMMSERVSTNGDPAAYGKKVAPPIAVEAPNTCPVLEFDIIASNYIIISQNYIP